MMMWRCYDDNNDAGDDGDAGDDAGDDAGYDYGYDFGDDDGDDGGDDDDENDDDGTHVFSVHGMSHWCLLRRERLRSWKGWNAHRVRSSQIGWHRWV